MANQPEIGNSGVGKHSGKEWSLGVEVAKIYETGVALGFDFNGMEEEILVRLSALEKADADRRGA